jgi:hypothetical protein
VVNGVTIASYITAFLLYLPNFITRRLGTGPDGRYMLLYHPVRATPAYQIGYMTVIVSLVSYIIPLLSLSFMSIRTLMSMKSNMISQSEERKAVRRDLTLSVSTIAIFLLCQSITAVTTILTWAYDPFFACLSPLQYYAMVSSVVMALNSATNFIIYIIFAKGFRKKVWKLLKRNKVVPNAGTGINGDSNETNNGSK